MPGLRISTQRRLLVASDTMHNINSLTVLITTKLCMLPEMTKAKIFLHLSVAQRYPENLEKFCRKNTSMCPRKIAKN